MYAVKGGHIDTVRELVRSEFLKYDVKNSVSAFFRCVAVHGHVLYFRIQKKQNVCHVAAREAQLECLQLLHEKSGDGPFLTKDGVGGGMGVSGYAAPRSGCACAGDGSE